MLKNGNYFGHNLSEMLNETWFTSETTTESEDSTSSVYTDKNY